MEMAELTEKLEQSEAGRQWKAVNVKHHHGINVPLFSLHDSQTCGVGEFPTLLALIDWCAELGMDVIQLLPINDSGAETSPYSAISAFALNPIYIGLSSLPNLDKHPHLQAWLPKLKTQEPFLKYSAVLEAKDLFLREYFRLERDNIFSSKEYQFFVSQQSWLNDYALFKALKAANNWSPWEKWDPILQNPSNELLKELYEKNDSEINYYKVMQFLCFHQMNQVKVHAISKGILIKGDIPISISRDSADVWRNRHLFIMDLSAGSLPDMFNFDGQNWGFPIFDWDTLEKDDYAWWRQRLQVAEQFYHLFRIDHIVGFFRIWSIPTGKWPKEGHYTPEDESKWIPQGRNIMKMMLSSSSMLPIGEDLGNVPPYVRTFLREMGICGTKVLRWERYWDTSGTYIPVKEYPPESMSTVSTHDSQTLKQWWKVSVDEAKAYAAFKGWEYNETLSNDQVYEILRDSHQSSSLFHINLLQEYLGMFPGMTWDNPELERINVPGICSDKNWCYRFIPSVEQIVTHHELAETMKKLISP